MRAKDFSRSFDEKNFADMVDFINSVFQNGITLEDNLSAEVIRDIELLGDGTEIKIPHRLKATPKYRIILRQDGSGDVIDGGEWNDRFITLSARSTQVQSVVFPGGTYPPNASGTTIPATNCNITYSTANLKVTILLLRG